MNKWVTRQKWKHPQERWGTLGRWTRPPGASAGIARLPVLSGLDKTICKNSCLIVRQEFCLVRSSLSVFCLLLSSSIISKYSQNKNIQVKRQSTENGTLLTHLFSWSSALPPMLREAVVSMEKRPTTTTTPMKSLHFGWCLNVEEENYVTKA